MTAALTVRLPYPPSANRLWRNVPGRVKPIRSAEYEAWLEAAAWEVCRIVAMQPDRRGVHGPYGLLLQCWPPIRRGPVSDLDNLLKPVSDALAKGKAITNDKFAQTITLEWSAGEPGFVTAHVMETALRLPEARRRERERTAA